MEKKKESDTVPFPTCPFLSTDLKIVGWFIWRLQKKRTQILFT